MLLRPTTLPAVLPITDKKLKTKRINLHARLETDTKIAVIHLVLVDVGMEEIQMTRNREKKVIVVRRQLGQFIFEHLGCAGGSFTFFGDHGLRRFGEEFIGQFSEPGFEQ